MYFYIYKNVIYNHEYKKNIGEMKKYILNNTLNKHSYYLDNIKISYDSQDETFIPLDNFAKIQNYTQDLQKKGIKCIYHPYYNNIETFFKDHQNFFDFILINREENFTNINSIFNARICSSWICHGCRSALWCSEHIIN